MICRESTSVADAGTAQAWPPLLNTVCPQGDRMAACPLERMCFSHAIARPSKMTYRLVERGRFRERGSATMRVYATLRCLRLIDGEIEVHGGSRFQVWPDTDDPDLIWYSEHHQGFAKADINYAGRSLWHKGGMIATVRDVGDQLLFTVAHYAQREGRMSVVIQRGEQAAVLPTQVHVPFRAFLRNIAAVLTAGLLIRPKLLYDPVVGELCKSLPDLDVRTVFVTSILLRTVLFPIDFHSGGP